MKEVYIKFKGTGREGTVAAGAYLIDAARRLGVDLDCECKTEEPTNACAVKIFKGTTLLSKPTSEEIEQLGEAERKDKQRLACQTKLEKPGEIEVMVVKKEVEEEEVKDDPEARTEAFKKDFAELPLDKKIASLVEIEAMALSDAFSYVLNSPYEAVGKVVEVMSGFGRDMEEKERAEKVPEEHREDTDASGEVKAAKDDPKDSTEVKDGAKSKTAKKTTATRRTRKTSKRTSSKSTGRKSVSKKKDDAKEES